MSQIETLKWDSEFFNLNVGKCDVSSGVDLLLLKQEVTKFDLIYLFSVNELDGFQSFLVDKKVRFVLSKKDARRFSLTERKSVVVEEFINDEYSYSQLLELVFQSGHKSRFFIDKKIGEERFKKLYTRWIDNAIYGVSNSKIFVVKENNEINAFIVQDLKELEMNISLVASRELSRGKGYGRALVEKVISNFLDSKYETLSVYTQLDNVGACKFYEKMGFKLENVNFIYHYWS